jgi:hypothetical protein
MCTWLRISWIDKQGRSDNTFRLLCNLRVWWTFQWHCCTSQRWYRRFGCIVTCIFWYCTNDRWVMRTSNKKLFSIHSQNHIDRSLLSTKCKEIEKAKGFRYGSSSHSSSQNENCSCCLLLAHCIGIRSSTKRCTRRRLCSLSQGWTFNIEQLPACSPLCSFCS